MFSELSVARQHRQWWFNLHLAYVCTVLLALSMHRQWEHTLLYVVILNTTKIWQKNSVLKCWKNTINLIFLNELDSCSHCYELLFTTAENVSQLNGRKWMVSISMTSSCHCDQTNLLWYWFFPSESVFLRDCSSFLSTRPSNECLWMSHTCYQFNSCLVFTRCAWKSTCFLKTKSQFSKIDNKTTLYLIQSTIFSCSCRENEQL